MARADDENLHVAYVEFGDHSAVVHANLALQLVDQDHARADVGNTPGNPWRSPGVHVSHPGLEEQATLKSKPKIATLHCLGSNPHRHANQKWHFMHCARACTSLADWVYPAGPNLLAPGVVRDLLKNGMGCTDDEVAAQRHSWQLQEKRGRRPSSPSGS